MTVSSRPVSRLEGRALNLRGILSVFWPRIGLTWAMTLIEVMLFGLVPLLIGWAIDGLLAKDFTAFWQLAGVLAALIVLGTLRRVYDTRAYGVMRVALGKALAARSPDVPVSQLNARMDMGRELVDFLEEEAPESATAVLHSLVAIVILATINPMLALSAIAAFVSMIAIYALAHRRFVSLNKVLNSQKEKQVGILGTRSMPRLGAHLLSLRRAEVRVSDTEGVVYGLIFTVLLGAVLFNLYYATQSMVVTAGLVFSIVAYSWDFVESALALPMTLQSLARLSEIVTRINQNEAST